MGWRAGLLTGQGLPRAVCHTLAVPPQLVQSHLDLKLGAFQGLSVKGGSGCSVSLTVRLLEPQIVYPGFAHVVFVNFFLFLFFGFGFDFVSHGLLRVSLAG